jgi:periplasmic protein CpxP/Spy
MLKESLLPLVISGLLFTAASMAVAQEDGTDDGQSAPSMQQSEQSGNRGMGPTQRTERLAKQLNLTSDQQAKVQGILQQQQTSMQNLRQDSSLSPQDRRTKMMDIRSATNTQIRSLLTADQQQKWDQMQQNHQQQGRGQNRDSGDDDADPQPPDQT